MSQATGIKEAGVYFYKQKQFSEALSFFSKALQMISKNLKQANKEIMDLYYSLISNSVNCLYQLKKYDDVIKETERGLRLKATPKLYYFRAIAYAFKLDVENAEKDLASLEKMLGENKSDEGVEYVRNLIKKKREESEKQKTRFWKKKIFKQELYEDMPKAIRLQPVPTEYNRGNPKVYMDIKIGNNELERVEFELFFDKVKLTVENFRCLCVGLALDKKGNPKCFRGSKFHKIVKGSYIHGGDFENNDGSGGKGAFQDSFNNENFYYAHSMPGLLTMHNTAPNTNASQFYITLRKCPELDGNNVVFGRVLTGMSVIEKAGQVETDEKGRPKEDIVIECCGEISKEKGEKEEKENDEDKKESEDNINN